MMKEIRTFVNQRTYEMIEKKANRCNMALPEIVRELLVIGVGA